MYFSISSLLLLWREIKKSPLDHIPASIKDSIRKLNFQYSKSKLRSSLDLSGCSLNFLTESKPQNIKLQEKAHFIELPSRLSSATSNIPTDINIRHILSTQNHFLACVFFYISCIIGKLFKRNVCKLKNQIIVIAISTKIIF